MACEFGRTFKTINSLLSKWGYILKNLEVILERLLDNPTNITPVTLTVIYFSNCFKLKLFLITALFINESRWFFCGYNTWLGKFTVETLRPYSKLDRSGKFLNIIFTLNPLLCSLVCHVQYFSTTALDFNGLT